MKLCNWQFLYKIAKRPVIMTVAPDGDRSDIGTWRVSSFLSISCIRKNLLGPALDSLMRSETDFWNFKTISNFRVTFISGSAGSKEIKDCFKKISANLSFQSTQVVRNTLLSKTLFVTSNV